MRTRCRSICMAVAALGVMTSAANAQWVKGTLSNFDVRNNTGATANDFELYLAGVNPSDVTSLYRGNYPNTAISDSTVIRWTGSTTPDGGVAHFGVGLRDSINPASVAMTWTFNGGIVGSIPDVAQKWDWLSGQQVARDDITNRSLTTVWIQRRVTTVLDLTLNLDDLLVGEPLWNAAQLIDPAPLPLLSNNTLTWDFDTTAGDSWFDVFNGVMMYDVYADAAGTVPIVTFLNSIAIAAVPEPATVVLLGLGGLMLLGLRRRR